MPASLRILVLEKSAAIIGPVEDATDEATTLLAHAYLTGSTGLVEIGWSVASHMRGPNAHICADNVVFARTRVPAARIVYAVDVPDGTRWDLVFDQTRAPERLGFNTPPWW